MKTKQTMLAARRADTFRSADPNQPIAWNAAIAEIRLLEPLAGQRLDRKSPELRHVHIS